MTFNELRMKYEEFKNKYNGKHIDYDGAYGYQCWDLAQKYFVDYLGVPGWVLSGSGLVSSMLDRDRHELDQYFEEIPVTQMSPGDVVIWEWGHIAIFDHYDGANWYFSQNPNPCQVMTIRQDGQHAFRLKGVHQEAPKVEEPPIVDTTALDNQIKELSTKNKDLTEQVTTLLDQIDNLTQNQPKQVFKCPKSGMYKIRLNEGETLYIG
jgi:hypothetical protein